MNESTKAVFLSYASQDAEAAKRIADALRGAGVEVWFDAEGGLEHGDEWDAKIRRQIKECVLFIPLISANTQAREEGYFRIEWELAAQRALGIASGVAFILPILIDGTREPDALVPDRFRTVQWTKLPGGAVPPDVLQRFLKLWSHRTGAMKHASDSIVGVSLDDARGRRQAAPLQEKSRRRWPLPMLAAAVLAALGAWFALRPAPTASVANPQSPISNAPATPAPSEARQLVEKADSLIHGLDAAREDFALAEEYCQRALKLDPDDGDVWAAYSQVHAAFAYRGWDTSPARKEQARVTAERAIRLAPGSVKARLAQAGAWAAFSINRDEREQLLRDIVREHPDNQETLRFLAVTVLAKPNGLEECLAINERSAALPGGDPLALFNNARYLWARGRPAEGYATLQRSLAQKPFTSALVLKMAMEITWRGDFEAATATMKRIPSTALQEDRANYHAGLLRYYQGRAEEALAIWQAFPRDYYADFIYEGPKGLLVGLADELDHRNVAAKLEWQAAQQLLEKRIAAAPTNPAPYYSLAFVLACLGEKTASGEALRTYEQLSGIKYTAEQPMSIGLAKIYVRLGRLDEVFAYPPAGGLAILRASPDFAALRADPRFSQLVDQGQTPPDPVMAKVTAAVAPDEKSVAVLAFADLSEKHDSEYFSDGISEELLNVLAKVPGLRVAARTSAFFFKGKEVPIPEIAKQLGVAYVVEGSVRKQGDKVRITAQLIKAADGFHVWSDTFTRDLKDIFAVQDEIAGVIAKNLELKMGMVAPRPTIDLEAYQEYLTGRALFAKASNHDLKAAIGHFEKALAIEPKFTAAWVQLASVHTQLGRWGGAPTLQAWAAARAAIDHAVALEPDSPDVLLALGWILRTADWNWRGAERAYRRALELRPNHPETLSAAAVLLFNMGRKEEALRFGRQAVALDPLNAASQIDLSLIFYFSEDFAAQEKLARRALQLAPTGEGYHGLLAYSLIEQGRFAEAEAEAGRETDEVTRVSVLGLLAVKRHQPAAARAYRKQLQELYRPQGDTADLQLGVAIISAELGDNDDAFAALEKLRSSRDAAVSWLRNDISLRPLYPDPRWDVLIHQVGLADDQLK